MKQRSQQLVRRGGDRLEHRLNVAGRPADDAQDGRGRGLPLERLARLVEQAHVLDRDHRLVGEDLQQPDVLLGEVARLLAADADRADDFAVADQRHGQVAAVADLHRRILQRVVGVGEDVVDVHRRALEHGARQDRCAAGLHREPGTHRCHSFRRGAMKGCQVNELAVEAPDAADTRVA